MAENSNQGSSSSPGVVKGEEEDLVKTKMAENSNQGSSSSPGVVKGEEVEQVQDSASMVRETMMNVLPSNTGKITKEALEVMEENTIRFISFVTTEANVFCKKEKRVVLEDRDVEWSLKILGLKSILDRYEVLDDELIESLLRQYNP